MSEWKEIPLDSFIREGSIELGRGDVISRDDIANAPGPYPIYSSSAQGDGRFGQYGKHMFDEELITWSVDGGGKLFYRPRHRYSVTNVCGYLRLSNDAFNYRFVHYLLDFQHRYISFDYQTKAHPSVIRHLYHLVPLPLPEQRKIARILTKVDNLIDKTEALIEKYKSIKQGVMHDLFTRGVDATGKLRPPYEQAPHLYKKSPLGWIPNEWVVDKFKNLTSILTCGVASTPPYVDEQNGVPFLSAQNVKSGRMSYHKYGYIPVDLHRSLTKHKKPQRGDILYTRVGYIGEAANVDVDWEFSFYVSLTLIRMKSGCSNYFYKHLLNGHDCKRLATRDVYVGGGVGNLNVNIVREFDMLVPDHREQDEIANRLDGIDELIAKEQKTLKKLHLTKSGLMQDLLTGKIRVTVDETEEVTTNV